MSRPRLPLIETLKGPPSGRLVSFSMCSVSVMPSRPQAECPPRSAAVWDVPANSRYTCRPARILVPLERLAQYLIARKTREDQNIVPQRRLERRRVVGLTELSHPILCNCDGGRQFRPLPIVDPGACRGSFSMPETGTPRPLGPVTRECVQLVFRSHQAICPRPEA